MINSYIRQLPKYFLFLTVIIPLLIDEGVFFSAVVPKTLIFTIFVLSAIITSVITGFIFKDVGKAVISKLWIVFKKPITIALTLFLVVTTIATFFAVDKVIAFWGNSERGDGLLTFIFLFFYFILVSVWFEKKDWVFFFKAILVVSAIVLAKEFIQVLDGSIRPVSFLPNTTILAGYLLGTITASGIVFIEDHHPFWRVVSIFIAFSAVVGIFFTETRGTILGLIVGIIVSMFYFLLKGKEVAIFKKYVLQNIAIGIFAIGFIFFGIFIATRDMSIWQSIPGLGRLANVNLSSGTASSRLMTWGAAIESIHPTYQTKEFLIGWGPENATLALAKYFNPLQYKFDSGIFDRSHNKFLDILVMTGVFGLLIYIILWFFIIKSHWVRKFNILDMVMVFFWISFLVHLLFIFDQNPTSILFFSAMGFSMYLLFQESEEVLPVERWSSVIGLLCIGVTIIFTMIGLSGPVTGYIIMHQYRELVQSKNLSEIQKNIHPLLEGNNIVQSEIRKDFLTKMTKIYGTFPTGSDLEKVSNELFYLALNRAENYAEQRPYDFRFLSSIVSAYNALGANNNTFLEKSELYLRKTLSFGPLRPEFNNNLVINLSHQGRFDEALGIAQSVIDQDPELITSYYYKAYTLALQDPKNYSEALMLFEKVFSITPELFEKNRKVNIIIYEKMIAYFYFQKDINSFLIGANRLIIVNNYAKKDLLQKIVDFIKKENYFPSIKFE